MAAICSNCSAPLPPGSTVCTYCGTRNDVDLKGVHEYTVARPETDRYCPECNVKMKTIDLNIEGHFYIEQCGECMGLFFDPNELEMLLEKSVENVFQIDHKRLQTIRKENVKTQRVKYLKCPVCEHMMNRKNFGDSSGVIIDWCGDHGIWLQGGELRRLLEWKKAGGEILAEKKREIRKQEKEKREEAHRRKERGYTEMNFGSAGTGGTSFNFSSSSSSGPDIVETVMDVIFKLFH